MCLAFAAVAPTVVCSAYLTSGACVHLSAVCKTTSDDARTLVDVILLHRAREEELCNEALERALLTTAELEQVDAEFEAGFYIGFYPDQ